jgi:hypothetical protein
MLGARMAQSAVRRHDLSVRTKWAERAAQDILQREILSLALWGHRFALGSSVGRATGFVPQLRRARRSDFRAPKRRLEALLSLWYKSGVARGEYKLTPHQTQLKLRPRVNGARRRSPVLCPPHRFHVVVAWGARFPWFGVNCPGMELRH